VRVVLVVLRVATAAMMAITLETQRLIPVLMDVVAKTGFAVGGDG
jgi:hypothetical protein